jgi:Holliday junction DNA helicase RuvA
MYHHLRGTLVSKQPTGVVLEVQGVGFALRVPLSTSAALPERGEAELFTELRIRDDRPCLYGFRTREERQAFQMLCEVTGVGPVLALQILSGCSLADLSRAVREGDVAGLERIRGVGKKTAQRLVVDLQDRLLPASGAGVSPEAGARRDAQAALQALGYDRPAARRMIEEAARALEAGASVEELVRASLRMRS